jgi:hypothetical protein
LRDDESSDNDESEGTAGLGCEASYLEGNRYSSIMAAKVVMRMGREVRGIIIVSFR